MALYEKYGGQNCLQLVDVEIVDKLLEAIGDGALQFVAPEYAVWAQQIFNGLNVQQLTFHNVWSVFGKMLPLMTL